MNLLLSLHLLALGIWIGVVAAEAFIEIDGLKDDYSYIKASKMHYSTDRFLEIPAFMIVLITGLLMLTELHINNRLFLFKVICALLAVAFNILCVYAVFVRNKFAVTSDIAGMESVDTLMKVSGAGFIPTFLITLGVGAYFLVVPLHL